MQKIIKNALISVYDKSGLEEVLKLLKVNNVEVISTGGTYDYIRKHKYDAIKVEDITSYPSILGGRVKTLHPIIFGGILARADNHDDIKELENFDIDLIDLVIVDLYPFEDTLKNNKSTDAEIIEKIDIGGISLIRAAAKNFNDVLVVPSKEYYKEFIDSYVANKGVFSLAERKYFAARAFSISHHYDKCIASYFQNDIPNYEQDTSQNTVLRYGENPHQKGLFKGSLDEYFIQLHGKALSYNNLLDLDAAIHLINDFSEPTFAILKHTNACGIASRSDLLRAYELAYASDSVSAFGGVLISNSEIDEKTAEKINELFFDIIAAPFYKKKSLEILKQKKNRVILQLHSFTLNKTTTRTILNGVLEQERDLKTETIDDLKVVTVQNPTLNEVEDMLFANKIAKHSKSNCIVIAKDKQMLASGVGQTSRVDALLYAISKAKSNGFDLRGAVMASDAFFPFADCVEIAFKEGIKAVIQPGGSIRDNESIDSCNKNGIVMVTTGIRHFKH